MSWRRETQRHFQRSYFRPISAISTGAGTDWCDRSAGVAFFTFRSHSKFLSNSHKKRTRLSNSLFNGNTQVQAPKLSQRRRISQKLLFWFRSIALSDKAVDDMIQHARIWTSLLREYFFQQDCEKEIKSRRSYIFGTARAKPRLRCQCLDISNKRSHSCQPSKVNVEKK